MHQLIQHSSAVIAILLLAVVTIHADVNELNGRYKYRSYDEEGQYYPTAEGQYIPTNEGQYVHVDDMRELGKYVHIPYPYDGGYGPYDGTNIPYVHDDSGQYIVEYPPTTRRPKRTYHDEGGWRIIRQEDNKHKKKYDFLYETENGIYAEEQGVIKKQNDEDEGTHGKGFYQYTGDDGKLYRVEYTVGEQGYVPKLHLFQDQPNTL